MHNITAKIIADSINLNNGVRITTFEVEFPRFILPEFNTHRMLSKNGASTRAVPINKMIENVQANTAEPVHWGMNNPGMTSRQELSDLQKHAARLVWHAARDSVISFVKVLSDKGFLNGHKQWVGRLLEPFTMMKMVVTGTEWNNFFHLRHHPDAQPEFFELARVMKQAMDESKPRMLSDTRKHWHLPYIHQEDGKFFTSQQEVTLEEAIKISVSCCAQVSYRNLDDSVEKALKIYDMLRIEDQESTEPKHMSPTEHIATPMPLYCSFESEPGTTHITRDGQCWSGNLRGWVQYRHLCKDESKKG